VVSAADPYGRNLGFLDRNEHVQQATSLDLVYKVDSVLV
jgi:hypothetical protein